MISIMREFEWDMGHRVTNHKSLCRNPHGHRYRMVIEISGDLENESGLSNQGMVLDFGDLKKLIHDCIVDDLDHSFMYWSNDDVMKNFAAINQDLRLVPVPFVPTVECIVVHIAEKIQGMLGRQLPGVVLESVVLFETPKCNSRWSRK